VIHVFIAIPVNALCGSCRKKPVAFSLFMQLMLVGTVNTVVGRCQNYTMKAERTFFLSNISKGHSRDITCPMCRV
jgi:hypothetical protein